MKYLHQTYHSRQHAPELHGDHWFNGGPLSIRELEGRPVVLYFWDCCSLRSKRMIPFINGLHALYYEFGLACIGVHSPVFEFARNADRIDREIRRNLILFPVVTDNTRIIADAYRISRMPAICLIDNKGDLYEVLWETFVPEQIERSLQYLLRQSGYYGELPLLLNPEFEDRYALPLDVVHEIHTGYAHGSLGNAEGYSPELAAEYRDPGLTVREKFYAQGLWQSVRDAMVYAGPPNGGYLTCRCEGDDLYVLAGSTPRSSFQVTVNGQPVSLSMMGDDVRKGKNGTTIVDVEEPTLLSIIRRNRSGENIVTMTPQSPGATVYLFSFVEQSLEPGISGPTVIRNN